MRDNFVAALVYPLIGVCIIGLFLAVGATGYKWGTERVALAMCKQAGFTSGKWDDTKALLTCTKDVPIGSNDIESLSKL